LRRGWLLIGALTFALATGLYLHSTIVSSAPQAQDQPPPPTFRTEANYVRVDAYPTRNDAPVADLTQDDFEVFDNGAPQKIEQFERVVVRAAVSQDARIEPNTVRESRSMLESSRSRVFVLFLDTGHVEPDASRVIRKPLVDALDKVIGADDLVGVMTPEMSAGDIAFARKTTTIDGILNRYWWGDRGRLNPVEPQEQDYLACYPFQPAISAEMIKRRREKRTLDALEDLVTYLRGVREERKAVLAITDGWLLYRPNPVLARPVNDTIPSGPRIGVDPRGGKLTTEAPKGGANETLCESDRLQLSQIDNDDQFRRLLDEANRSNTSFYPVDPRGLVVFDTPIAEPGGRGLAPMTPLTVDAAMLRTRLTSLRTLAETTDGLAIVNSNNIAAGLKRVVDDLSAYYLLGYYASGKLDGKFHAITVRVKRPGVRVRARRGYLAASEAAVRATAAGRGSASPASAVSPAAVAEARAIDVALSPLEGYTRQLPIRMHAAAGWKPDSAAAVWTIGELGAGPEWRGGADADLSLTSASGATLASARAHVDAGGRGFRAALVPGSPLAPGDYMVRVRVKSADAATSASDTLRITLPGAPDATGAIFVRRGPATANREIATSDLRFRRSEQLRIEVPTPSSAAVTARLLDRTGKPLAVPVTVVVRDDSDGSRWQVAQLALAPLAPADYLIEIVEPGGAGGDQKRRLLAFRVVP